MALNETQIGILKDVRDNKVSLENCGEWLLDQLAQVTLLDGPLLIDTLGPNVFLTEAGATALKGTQHEQRPS